MKKIIVITLMAIAVVFTSCCPNTCAAQTVDSTLTELSVDGIQVTEAERLLDKYAGKMYEGAVEIAEAISGPAKEAFDYVVMLQIAKGIGMLIPLLLFIISLTVILITATRFECNEESVGGVVCMAFIVIGALSLVLSFFTTYDAVLHLIAPEWFAIKEIMALIK